jgi:uncharacterized damage-inducible protein DinB
MKATELIAQHIIEAFEGGNWTEVNFKDALRDISYRDATMVTKASCNTIAALIHHVAFYNDVIRKKLEGITTIAYDHDSFKVPLVKNENDWMNLKDRCFQSVHDLAATVIKLPDEMLTAPIDNGNGTYYKTLHGLIEHLYYHLGQIVFLKRLARLPAPQLLISNSL